MQKVLRQIGTNRVYPYDEMLSRRADIVVANATVVDGGLRVRVPRTIQHDTHEEIVVGGTPTVEDAGDGTLRSAQVGLVEDVVGTVDVVEPVETVDVVEDVVEPVEIVDVTPVIPDNTQDFMEQENAEPAQDDELSALEDLLGGE